MSLSEISREELIVLKIYRYLTGGYNVEMVDNITQKVFDVASIRYGVSRADVDRALDSLKFFRLVRKPTPNGQRLHPTRLRFDEGALKDIGEDASPLEMAVLEILAVVDDDDFPEWNEVIGVVVSRFNLHVPDDTTALRNTMIYYKLIDISSGTSHPFITKHGKQVLASRPT